MKPPKTPCTCTLHTHQYTCIYKAHCVHTCMYILVHMHICTIDTQPISETTSVLTVVWLDQKYKDVE